MKKMIWLLVAGLSAGCMGDPSQRPAPRAALFIGVDVSGSFYKTKHYPDSLEFLAYYIHRHLNGPAPAKDLYVGTIGGTAANESKSFRPIHDFQDRSVEQIHGELKSWYAMKPDSFTDFNVFFQRVSEIAQKRNMALAPVQIVVVSDGILDVPGKGLRPEIGDYKKIDLSPIEYLSRNVTVRLLYSDPTVSNKWETGIPRQRARMWTVDNQVMSGWKAQVQPGVPVDQQEKLWKWMADNVDYRVKAVKFQKLAKKNRR
jgi:hypothetical protein